MILKCLKYDLNERYDANSLLKHPWFDSDNNSTISPGLEDRLKIYQIVMMIYRVIHVNVKYKETTN